MSHQPWENSLVGRFHGCPISLKKVHVGLSSGWTPQGKWEIFPMPFGYFIFRFTNNEDVDHVLLDGHWALDDAVLVLARWTPDFCPLPELLPKATVWMRIPDLSPVLWTRPALALLVVYSWSSCSTWSSHWAADQGEICKSGGGHWLFLASCAWLWWGFQELRLTSILAKVWVWTHPPLL